MSFSIEAACACNIGKIRVNNEDNFFFNGRFLDTTNSALQETLAIETTLDKAQVFAVFDGMGGENYGEHASYASAECLSRAMGSFSDDAVAAEVFLDTVAKEMNKEVLKRANEHLTRHMGTTMAVVLFSEDYAYVCNLGDSRVYRWRDGVLLQLSVDHVSELYIKRGKNDKAPLSQYLGIPEEEFIIEPHIAKGELITGDSYLLCSDGLTDMITNEEISEIMCECADARICAQSLLDAALEKGGRDNITCIVVNIC